MMHVATLSALIPIQGMDCAEHVSVRVLFSPRDPLCVRMQFVQSPPAMWSLSREVLTTVLNLPPGPECGLGDAKVSRDPGNPDVVQLALEAPAGSAVVWLDRAELERSLRAMLRVSPADSVQDVIDAEMRVFLARCDLSTGEVAHPLGW